METMNLPCKIAGCPSKGTTHGDAISSEYALCYNHYQQWFLPEYPSFVGDFITAVNKANAIHCELCSRYGVKTPVTGEIFQKLEGEDITKVYEFVENPLYPSQPKKLCLTCLRTRVHPTVSCLMIHEQINRTEAVSEA